MMLCKIVQWRIRLAEEPADLSMVPRLADHLQRCPSCRAYHRHIIRMEEDLQAAPTRTIAPQDYKRIEASILHRLGQTERLHLPATGSTPSPRPARTIAAAAAAMLLIATLLFVGHKRPLLEPPTETSTLAALRSDSERLTHELTQLMRMPERSIHNEMHNLAQDARRAVVFLLNCTPSHPLPDLDNGT